MSSNQLAKLTNNETIKSIQSGSSCLYFGFVDGGRVPIGCHSQHSRQKITFQFLLHIVSFCNKRVSKEVLVPHYQYFQSINEKKNLYPIQ